MADNSKSADAAAPPQDDVTPHPISPITLTAPGEREVVDAARAGEIVSHWRSQLDAHRERLAAAGLDDTNDSGTGTNSTQEDVVLCDRIVLTDKSYTAEAAAVIATFLASDQPPPHARPLALAATHADLSDVIASRMEGEGLTVLRTLCDAFGGGRLRSVDLSDNAMGCKGVTACASVLGGQASTLRELRLCNNGLSEETMGEVASILTAPVGKGEAGAAAGGGETADENGGNEHAPCVASNLTKIHFYNNMSGDRGGEEFARILSRCTSSNLTDVRFSGTRARRPGSLMVANALHSLAAGGGGGGGSGPNDDDGASNANHLSNLTRLDLADNTFGYEGGDVLAKALHGCPNLAYLNLRDCVLEDDATKFICHALWSSGAPIEHLDLSGNEIGPRGARALGDLVEEVGASTLRVLHLEENEMTSRGVRCIARSLTSAAEDGGGEGGGGDGDGDGGGGCGCVLEDLRLGSNECGRIGAAALVAAAPALLPNLKSLGFDGNMIPEEMVAELEAAFGGEEKVLGSMEDNDPDEDVDEEMESEDEEGEGEDDAGAAEDTGEKGDGAGGDDGGGAADVDALTAAVGGITIDGFC